MHNNHQTMKRSWADGRRLSKKEGGYQWMYDSPQWQARRRQQLRHHPLCAACLQDNVIKAATVAHHVQDHKGDWGLFCNSPLESLCKPCHDHVYLGSEVLGYQPGFDISGRPYKTHSIYIDKNKRAKPGVAKNIGSSSFNLAADPFCES
jgi:5-methylcytosine-specific restriction enzyme A